MKKILAITAALLLGTGAFAQSGNPVSSWWERITSGSKSKKAKTEALAPASDNVLSDTTAVAAEPEVPVARTYDVSVALVLPFAASGENPHYPSFDFYCGALTAMDRLAEEDSAKIDLKVCDCGSGAVYSTRDIEKCDIVVGPISATQIKVLSARLRNSKYIISPLDQGAASLADSIPVVQFATPSRPQLEELARWAAEDLAETDSLIVIKNSEQEEKCAGIILDELAETQVPYTLLQCATFENLYDIFVQYTSAGGARKRFLIASEAEEFCRRILSVLARRVSEGADLHTWCTSKVRVVSMPVEEKASCDIHFTASYFIDDARDDVAEFESRYKSIYGARPNSFAYQGYDIFNYFIQIARTLGPDWADSLATMPSSALQSDIRFEAASVGFTNSGVRRITFNSDGTTSLAFQ